MAIDRASFILRFPEFARADTAAVTQAIADVDENTSDTYDTEELREYVVMLRTADVLASSPSGRDAQVTTPEGPMTSYGLRLQQILQAHACLHPLKLGVD